MNNTPLKKFRCFWDGLGGTPWRTGMPAPGRPDGPSPRGTIIEAEDERSARRKFLEMPTHAERCSGRNGYGHETFTVIEIKD